MIVKELASTKLNSLTVKLFEYDIDNEQSFTDLKEYLVKKIKNSKVKTLELILFKLLFFFRKLATRTFWFIFFFTFIRVFQSIFS